MKAKSVILALATVFGLVTILTMTSANLPQDKAWKTPANYTKMKATKSTPETIKAGKTLYDKHCKSCHGTTGKGDGTKAASLKSTIKPFSDKAFKALTDGDKYYRSFVGRDEMPNFEKKIVEEDARWSVIHYINTL